MTEPYKVDPGTTHTYEVLGIRFKTWSAPPYADRFTAYIQGNRDIRESGMSEEEALGKLIIRLHRDGIRSRTVEGALTVVNEDEEQP